MFNSPCPCVKSLSLDEDKMVLLVVGLSFSLFLNGFLNAFVVCTLVPDTHPTFSKHRDYNFNEYHVD